MAEKRDEKLIKLKHVRLSFPHLWKAEGFAGDPNSNPKFSAAFLFSKNTAEGKALADLIDDEIDRVIDEKWPKNPPKFKDDKLPLRDGDERETPTEGYDGHMYLSASSLTRPKVMKSDGKTPLTEADGELFAGDVVNAWVRIWAQDHQKWGKRVNASLEAVQFVREGERFGAAPVSDEIFEDERSEDERNGRRSRSRDDDREERPSRRRHDEDDRGSRRSRDDDDRGSRRSRDDDDDRAEHRARREV